MEDSMTSHFETILVLIGTFDFNSVFIFKKRKKENRNKKPLMETKDVLYICSIVKPTCLKGWSTLNI